MKYCSNCGESLAPNTTNCPNCHQPVNSTENVDIPSIQATEISSENGAEEEVSSVQEGSNNETSPVSEEISSEQPSAKDEASVGTSSQTIPQAPMSIPVGGDSSNSGSTKKKSNTMVIAIVAILVLCIGGFAATKLFSGGGVDNPFLNYQAQFVVNRLQPLMDASISKDGTFSSDMTLTAKASGIPEAEVLLEDSSLVIKMDSSNDHLLSNLALNLKGTPLFNAAFHIDKDQLGFHFPEGDGNYYVGNTEKLLDALTDGEIQNADQLFGGMSQEDLNLFLQEWLRIVDTAFTKENMTVEDKEVELEELGETFQGKVYTFKPKQEDVERAFVAFADTLEKNEKFRQTIVKFSASQYYNMSSDMDALKAEEDLLDLAKKIKEDPASYVGDFSEDDFEWSIAVEKEAVRKITFMVEDEGLIYEATAPAEKGEFNEKLYFLTMDDSIEFMYSNDYSKDGLKYEGTMGFEVPGQANFLIDYDVDLSQKYLLFPLGTYAFSIPETPYLTMNMEVAAGENDSIDHNFTASLMFFGEQKVELNLNATKKSTATKPDVASEDISDYSKEEISALLEENLSILSEGIEQVLSDLG